ncbi:MAG: histone deacetylase family protein, partial [Thermodesulfovibrionales bacterium]
MAHVGFLYDEVFLRHDTPDYHPERGERLTAIVKALKGSQLWERLVHIRPEPAESGDIEAVHTPEYVARIRDSEPAYLDPDTYLSPNSYEAARYAAGSLITAVNECLAGKIDRAFCAVRPPGHHAEAGRAMGFCIFNNVAVGARYAQRMGLRRVFIADFDVHHGNGTEHMFYDDDTVFYFSTHQYPHYPGT